MVTKRPLGIYLLCLVVLATLAGGIYWWTAVVPRLISGTGPKPAVEWIAIIVLSALPFSAPPAAIGAWQRSRWAPGAVAIWGALCIGEVILTFLPAGILAGLTGTEWVLSWIAILCAVGALVGVVRYVGRVVAAVSEPSSASSM